MQANSNDKNSNSFNDNYLSQVLLERSGTTYGNIILINKLATGKAIVAKVKINLICYCSFSQSIKVS